MKCNRMYKFTEDKIGGAFARYGRFVSHHAWKIIIITLVVNGGLAIGMMDLKTEIEAGEIYLPKGSRAREDQDTVVNTFPDLTDINYNSFREVNLYGTYARVLVKAKHGELLTRAMLEKVEQLDAFVQNIAIDKGKTKFTNICAAVRTRCVLEASLFWDPGFLSAVDNHNVTYPSFNVTGMGPVEYSTLVGGKVKLDPTGQYLVSVEYLHLKYAFRTNFGTSFAERWVEKFTEELSDYTSPDLDIAFGHYKSLDKELDKNVAGDIQLFALTIALMMVYAGLATVSSRLTDQVNQRIILGFAGILTAGLAIVAGFGFCAAVGVDFVSIVGVVPFLVVGVGIDDMFILLSGLSGAQEKTTVDDKMAETMRSSGVGITITSLTDLIAFLVGSFSSYTAVSNFCIYTGVSILLCYINNVTFYAACIAINERRVDMNRHYLICRRIKTKDELRKDRKSKLTVLCCSGQRPKNRDEAESIFDKLPRWIFPRIVLKLPLKIIIIFVFLGYLAGAIYGCIFLKQGLLFTQLVSKDSYFYKYSNIIEEDFQRLVPVSFVFTDTYNYSDPRTTGFIDKLISKAQTNDFIDDNFSINWLNSYKSSPYFNDTNEASFISGLDNFIQEPQYYHFLNDYVTNEARTQIIASRVLVLSRPLADSQEEGELMLEVRDIADNAEIKCFAYSPLFVVAEQYVSILGQSLQSVGIALAAVFVITCIFMPHPVLILFVTVAVTMIMAGVFGYMYYVDVALSAITMIELIMGVGFSIDFTAHICHGYMVSHGDSRDSKVRQSIDKTGAPIFHGAVSSLVGIATLALAKSYVFTTFGIVMTFVLIFGIAHALLLLPVLLSWIGPKSSGIVEDVSVNEESNYHEVTMNGVRNKALTLTDENGGPSTTQTHKATTDRSKQNHLSDLTRFHENSSRFHLHFSKDGKQCTWTSEK